ncbi:Glycerol-3-phosphate dehydrogenase [Candidatus Phytoplasma mali]|uniref:Glycerol-3-phosphate dehydrogenase [NAD(P)+] n=1 Tax=Phytoplasma mali (strain AT) TaxID=482235 RepID=GPDA_PHYMT|nr:NAD(P)H-dependent glycerol-3-phosphate dehydrogenase [Candidatus Phytoplasma mali]B3R0E3.1 RecName: Full=Glycerol-3-phosphate dehydrogenase [NAD(P)+]; AltName: Full=NAD(P)H-dependent glycerol-3-phosphate dehydrogenase [Candidatus Phytoplasma mali AT]CAP18307.1 Glycerol-3-phosphate dehydrogenase [Candidatus Phytoplasma mali]
MKISIIGGGAWGSTLAQLLTDNNHQILINEINLEYVNKINNGIHPIFNQILKDVKATVSLSETLEFSDFIVLCLPTRVMRLTLRKINKIISQPKYFINVSKGMEIENYKIIYQIVQEEITIQNIKNYACVMGPSHAEDVILRKLTLLVAASLDFSFACKVQKIFYNYNYLRVYSSNDLYGVEICSAFKNVLALISGVLDSFDFGYNFQAGFISRGLLEMAKVVDFFKGDKQTVFGLTGLGDLIVTAFNENSRNYQAGKKIGLGMEIKDIIKNSSQSIEGINNLKAFYNLSLEKKIDLPIVKEAYQMIFNYKSIKIILNNLLKRPLKLEKIF